MQQRSNVHDVALGKWLGILLAMGVPESALTGRHGPCPVCGGTDRFRFDDKDGRGTWFCNSCGAGSGIDLVMRLKGCDFRGAALEIERIAGVVQNGPKIRPIEQDKATKVAKLRRVWAEASPLQEGDEAMLYLAGRGLDLKTLPDCLRLHPGLPYFDGRNEVGTFPALVARVVASDGSGATLHRTYLKDARKAPVPAPRKLMPGKPIAGAAVRLAPAGEWLGIAEGIETALAAGQLFNCAVWSVISTAGIENFEPPAGVHTLTIFADNDGNYAGQSAAYDCAHRLALRGVTVEVCTPSEVGDWLDVLNRREVAA